MNKLRLASLVGGTLLIGGAFLLITLIRAQQTSVIASPASGRVAIQAAPKAAIQGNPVRLQIPSLAMDLSVIPGVYNPKSQTWTLTTDKAQYATITPEPNNLSGNTFIYGHYRREVFANLHKITANAEAELTTDNGYTFRYRLDTVKVVSPSDSAAVFAYQGPPVLTIQTCTGLFFQNRQLFTFTFEGVAPTKGTS